MNNTINTTTANAINTTSSYIANRSKNHNHTSWKKMVLTRHCKQRSFERVGINNEEELKKMACGARFKGIELDKVNIYTYEGFGLAYNEMVALKNQFKYITKSDRIFYYKSYVWIFAGNNALTLRSVVVPNIKNEL